jgi:GT2 family glycosyltransferase
VSGVPFASVVVASFRPEDELLATLRALERQSLDASEYEVVVAAPRGDERAGRAAVWGPRFPHRVALHDGGAADARRAGAASARGEVIVFLDAGCVPHPELLAAYTARLRAGDADVVSGRRLWTHGAAGDARGFEEQIDELCRDHPRALARAFAFVGSNVAVRRAALAQTTGFFPGFARHDDVDVGLQLALRGARFACEPRAETVELMRAADTSDDRADFEALLTRHPFVTVVLWRCWTQAPNVPPLTRLSDIARLEAERAEVDFQALAAERGVFLPLYFHVTEDAFVEHLRANFRVDAARYRAHLARGRAQGLVHRRHGSTVVLDFAATTSWIADHTEFRQHVYEHSFFAHHPTPRQQGRTGAPAVAVRWEGAYEAEIPASVMGGSDALFANLPLPVATRCQTEVRVGGWEPPELGAFCHDGAIVGYPLPPGAERPVRLRYTFSCRVTEWDETLPDPDRDVDLAVFLRPLSLRHAAPVEALARRIPDADRGAPTDRARAIFRWLLDHAEHRTNALERMTSVRTGLGQCIQLSTAFVALCRRVEVPARLRSGALVNWHQQADAPWTGEDREFFSPFVHTWAEFFDPARGWVPVELLTVAHGRDLSPWSFPDAELRQAVAREQPLYDAYYAGGLDPFRIHGSGWATRLPTVARRGASIAPSFDVRLAVRQRVVVRGEPEPP